MAIVSQHTARFPGFGRTETTAEVQLQVSRLTDARGEAEFIWLKYVIPEPERAQGAPVLQFVTWIYPYMYITSVHTIQSRMAKTGGIMKTIVLGVGLEGDQV